MTVDKQDAGRVIIWDLPVRFIHWSIVALIPLAWWSYEVDRMAVHRACGYGVLALASVRIAWGFAGSETARFANFLRGPRKVAAYLSGRAPHYVGHNPLGGWSVAALLGVLAIQSLLGLFAVDRDGLDPGPLTGLLSDDHAESAEHLHAILFYVLVALAALHLAAIVFHALRGRNLVWPMVTGRAGIDPDMAPRPASKPLEVCALCLGALLFAALFWWGG